MANRIDDTVIRMLRELKACDEGLEWVMEHPKGWSGTRLWETCKEPMWMLWFIAQAYHTELVPRRVNLAVIELMREPWDSTYAGICGLSFDELFAGDPNSMHRNFLPEVFDGQHCFWLAMRAYLDGATPVWYTRSALLEHHMHVTGGLSFAALDRIDVSICRALRTVMPYANLNKRITRRLKDTHGPSSGTPSYEQHP